ncbi:hypothetical protein GN316_06760 [Xylophilus sp. Kf1]|nr:hypothetical protein [Xylophilus sp. Kf1]
MVNINELRAYRGMYRRIVLTGLAVLAAPASFAGVFRASTATAVADNGGTVIIDALGRTWKREFDGYVRPEWFDATPAGNAISRAAIVSALAAGPVVFSAGKTYLIDAAIAVASGARIKAEPGSVLKCTMTAQGFKSAIFTNVGGSNIRITNVKLLNIPITDQDYDRFLFRGLSVSDVVIDGSDCTDCANAYFGTTATDYAAVQTDKKKAGFNQSTDVHVTNFKVRGNPNNRLLVGQANYFFYCKNWSAVKGDVQDSYYPVMFWGGDSGKADGAVGNERKCSQGRISQVTSRRTSAGPWGSMGDDITVSLCNGTDGLDVGVDFEGCTNFKADNCSMTRFANGNFATFFRCKNGVFTSCISVQESATAPHLRIYNDSNDGSKNRRIGFYGGTVRTNGAIGIVEDGAGPASELTFAKNKLFDTKINFSAPNKENLAVEDNVLIFNLAAMSAMHAISVTGCSGTLGRILRNTVRSNVNQPAGSMAIHAVNTDGNFAPVIEIKGNVTAGFPIDLTVGCTSANRGQPGLFVVEDNQFGSAAVAFINRDRVQWKYQRNRNGASRSLLNSTNPEKFLPA